MRRPSRAEIAAAFEGGSPVRCGLPVRVACAGGARAHLNLAAAARGDADPWILWREHAPGIQEWASADQWAVYVGDVRATEPSAVIGAFAAAPPAGEEHVAGADAARAAAGLAALGIDNASTRALVLDAVDGWAGLAAIATVIDSDQVDGQLIDLQAVGLPAGLLIVRCPSTGRTYSLLVPPEHRTAREARRWTMHGVSPEVES